MRRDWLLAAALALFSGALIDGCSPSPLTQLIVVVDTDYAIPGGLDEIDIDVVGPDGMDHLERQPMPSTGALPYTLALVPTGALGPIQVQARGLLSGTVVVSRSGRATLLVGETQMMRLYLRHACGGVVCTGESTCGEDATCNSIDVPLDPWTGTAPRLTDDAGPPRDGGLHDAGPMMDGGPMNDAGPGHDANVPDAGDCHAAGCDDGEPCTDDACGTDGHCTHANNALACSDGLFCNGMDTCGSGSCSVHAGSPCGGGMCDEATGHCGGCTTDSDCPSPVMGAFGACGGFASACATTGTHDRTVQTFHCVSRACVPTSSTDTQTCTQPTDGVMCGATSCGAYGVCGSSAFCATTGTQTRTCTDMVCAAGACGSAARMESAACTRVTAGMMCSASTCGGYGACGGFADTCTLSGTQSRTCMDFACAAGACAPTSRMDSTGCTRGTTDGTMCSATTCGAWSTCAYGPFGCSATGPSTRTCMDYACGSGSCAATARTESMACPVRPSGTSCGNPIMQCGTYACNTTGGCVGTGGQCTGSRAYCCHDDPPYCVLSAQQCILR